MHCNLSLECSVKYDVTTAHKVFLDSHWYTVASFIFHSNGMGTFSEAIYAVIPDRIDKADKRIG